MRIVVGVDGSGGSNHALRWAVDEGRRRHARVEAVHAWHYPYLPTPAFVTPPSPDVDKFERAARVVLDGAVDAVASEGLPASIERTLSWEDATSALLDASKGADLLVVGSRGRGGFAGLLLGSVSQEVAHHAPCPVVIVPSEYRVDATPTEEAR
jgi:nucleotide-binding universal stress UspA family protein